MRVLAVVVAALVAPAAWGQRPPRVPVAAVEYTPARYTQSIFRLDERPTVRLVSITDLPDRKWLQSGGMEGVTGATSRKFKFIPDGKAVVTKAAGIQVKNSFGYYQTERGVVRSYPDGTRFDDVLSTAAGVFEHRVREKVEGRWQSRVEYRDVDARPAGYAGLKVGCATCHDESGSGGYGVGLVPGGDTVLSDPLDWRVLGSGWKAEGR